MNVEERIKRIRLIDKIDKNQKFSQKIGVRNRSDFIPEKNRKTNTLSHS